MPQVSRLENVHLAGNLLLTGLLPAGVLQVEAMAQLGGIILMDPEKDAESQQNFFFGGIEGCKFRRPVVPGDTLVRLKLFTSFQFLTACMPFTI